MNWKNRFTNYNFWISMISAVLLILQAFKFEFDIAYINEIATAVLGLLVVIGIISDPTKTSVKSQSQETKEQVKSKEKVQSVTEKVEVPSNNQNETADVGFEGDNETALIDDKKISNSNKAEFLNLEKMNESKEFNNLIKQISAGISKKSIEQNQTNNAIKNDLNNAQNLKPKDIENIRLEFKKIVEQISNAISKEVENSMQEKDFANVEKSQNEVQNEVQNAEIYQEQVENLKPVTTAQQTVEIIPSNQEQTTIETIQQTLQEEIQEATQEEIQPEAVQEGIQSEPIQEGIQEAVQETIQTEEIQPEPIQQEKEAIKNLSEVEEVEQVEGAQEVEQEKTEEILRSEEQLQEEKIEPEEAITFKIVN